MTKRAEQERVQALRRYRIVDAPPDAHLGAVARLAASISGTEDAAVNLLDEETQWTVAMASGATSQAPRRDSYCTHTMDAPGPVVVSDARRDASPVSSRIPLVSGAGWDAKTP